MSQPIPQEFLERILAVPDAEWMPPREEPTADIREVLRTPDERFADLPGFPFAPRYATLPRRFGQSLRVHYVDEGPADAAETVVCIHGMPAWSYLYRHLIPELAGAGLRVIAVDQVGAGRSDKPAAADDYSCARHVRWMGDFFEALDLRGVTLLCQDWGTVVGLQVLGQMPERFCRVLVTNGLLPGPDFGEWDGQHAGDMVPAFMLWLRARLLVPSWGASIQQAVHGRTLTPGEVAAYDAPFPERRYDVGTRRFPALAPLWRGFPSTDPCRHAWQVLSRWQKPFLTAWGEQDDMHPLPGAPRRFIDRIPGCAGQPHTTFPSGHFSPEEQGPLLARTLVRFVETNPA